MDIQLASNFERYLYYLYDQNPSRLRAAFEELSANGSIFFSDLEMERVRNEFLSLSVNQQETLETISEFYTETGYFLDPHTAVGVRAAKILVPEDQTAICLATAHPAKFGEAVFKATGHNAPLPPSLQGIEKLPSRCVIMDADLQLIKDFVKDKAR
jgi:threonine synthase